MTGLEVLIGGFLLGAGALAFILLKQKVWGVPGPDSAFSRDDFGDGLSVDSSAYWRPIRRLMIEIESLLEKATDPIIRGMTDAVRSELTSVRIRTEDHLSARDKLNAGLLSASNTRSVEVEQATRVLDRIERDLGELQGRLETLRSKLALTGALAGTEHLEDELRDNLANLQSFEVTASEANEFLNG